MKRGRGGGRKEEGYLRVEDKNAARKTSISIFFYYNFKNIT